MDVEREALISVKLALGTFQSEIAGIANTAASRRAGCEADCEYQIQDTQYKVEVLEEEVKRLSDRISELEKRIEDDEYREHKISEALPPLYDKVDHMKYQLQELSAAEARIRNNLGHADEDSRDAMEDQLADIREMESSLMTAIHDTEDRISDMEAEKTRLISEINELSYEKSETENQLEQTKKRLYRYQDKLQRLKTAGNRLKDDFDAYVAAVEQFESISDASAAQKQLVLTQCISLVDEMESVFGR